MSSQYLRRFCTAVALPLTVLKPLSYAPIAILLAEAISREKYPALFWPLCAIIWCNLLMHIYLRVTTPKESK